MYEIICVHISGLKRGIIKGIGDDDGVRIIVTNSAESPAIDGFLKSYLIPSNSNTYISLYPKIVSTIMKWLKIEKKFWNLEIIRNS